MRAGQLTFLLLFVFCSLIFQCGVRAQSSASSISFQGALTGANGQPLPNGNYSLTFKFYDAPTNGTALATSHVPNVPVTGGIVSTPIPVDTAWFNGQTRYLGIGINGGAELSPRVLITAVPYALTARGLFAPNGAIAGSDSLRQNPAFDVITYETPEVHGEDAPNWRNSGRDAKFYRALSSNWNPNVGYGFAIGQDINSPEIWMLDHIGNSFAVSAVDPGEHVANGRPVFSVKPNGELKGNWLTLTSAPQGTEKILRVHDPNDQPLLVVHSSGTTSVRVLQITGGADLAEHLSVTDANPRDEFKVEPGMVVSINPAGDRKFKLSNERYDRKRVGIISGGNGVQPGLVLRDEGNPHADGEQPIALTGQVWCHADAAFGPITPGDLLTTSSTPGHAMKVSDDAKARFAVLGQALTGLAEGRGWVQVLVRCQ